MKTIVKTPILLCALLAAGSASAGLVGMGERVGAPSASGKLQYLSAVDEDAASMLACADLVGPRPTGAVYEKAGRAAVIKAALTGVDDGNPPKVANASLTDWRIERMVSSDLAVHEAVARHRVSRLTPSDAQTALADCVTPDRVKDASRLGEWLDTDVTVLKDVK